MRIHLPVLLGLGAALLLAGTAPARAGIYQWTDKSGEVHFTSDPMQVPPRYRGGPAESAARETSERPVAPSTAVPSRRAAPGRARTAPPMRPGALDSLKAQTQRPAPTLSREVEAPRAAQPPASER